jgi:hypothetical protein
MKSSNHTLNLHRLTSCTLLYSWSLLLSCRTPLRNLTTTPSAYCCTPAGHCLLRNLITYEDAARTHLTENTSRDTMHCCVTSPSMCRLSGHKENAASCTVMCAYFGRGLQMTSFYCYLLERVYGADVWQWVFTLKYKYWRTGGMRIGREDHNSHLNTRRKSVWVWFRRPQIPHGLDRNGTRDTTFGSRWLITWARPRQHIITFSVVAGIAQSIQRLATGWTTERLEFESR